MTFIQEYAIGQFGKRIVNKLAKKGIKVVGSHVAPDNNGEFANGDVVYGLDDNGTYKVRKYSEVLALAK